MSKQPAIIVDNVSMKFNLSKEKVDSLKDYIIKSIKKEIKYNEFWALQNVQLQNMGRWFRFWNWVQDLINSIQERKIFIFTEQCLDIPKNLLMRSMMRS